jgi:hypothetical protein
VSRNARVAQCTRLALTVQDSIGRSAAFEYWRTLHVTKSLSSCSRFIFPAKDITPACHCTVPCAAAAPHQALRPRSGEVTTTHTVIHADRRNSVTGELRGRDERTNRHYQPSLRYMNENPRVIIHYHTASDLACSQRPHKIGSSWTCQPDTVLMCISQVMDNVNTGCQYDLQHSTPHPDAGLLYIVFQPTKTGLTRAHTHAICPAAMSL